MISVVTVRTMTPTTLTIFWSRSYGLSPNELQASRKIWAKPKAFGNGVPRAMKKQE
jgi:hypothetical protein